MKNTMTYLSVGTVVFLSVMLLAGSVFAVNIQGTGGTTNPYGYYNPSGYYGGNSGCGGSMPYGGMPYPQQQQQQLTQFCMQWRPQQWIPVQVMVPGRWETKPVWIPGQQVTLYRSMPGYWQRTNMDGTPDVSVYRTQNGWYARPYQPQASGGYFDSQGIWHESQK